MKIFKELATNFMKCDKMFSKDMNYDMAMSYALQAYGL